MIKISKMADYGMQIMQTLTQTRTRLSAAKIAGKTNISEATVSKLLKILTTHGLLNSRQGGNGGYQLHKPAERISVADVIAAIDGVLALTECCKVDSACAQAAHCGQQANWKKVNMIVFRVLSNISLQEMALPLTPQKVRVLLQ